MKFVEFMEFIDFTYLKDCIEFMDITEFYGSYGRIYETHDFYGTLEFCETYGIMEVFYFIGFYCCHVLYGIHGFHGLYRIQWYYRTHGMIWKILWNPSNLWKPWILWNSWNIVSFLLPLIYELTERNALMIINCVDRMCLESVGSYFACTSATWMCAQVFTIEDTWKQLRP